ncbi:hypothetical protein SC1083_0575 [Aggregatibacter actinomycetemcomitans serotype e str. SC1083]|uniref:Uncharacterized protein n=1 Tax=Aggregatibacter actinomycetemcomitans serotype e str. SC1083 TaxID=907488 RepID=G4A6Y5_AGGAC|nr:hypothetical protein SC1083_0575 [Aggregatibacter actinomycetemcomitans serotype e str. SC1083]
MILVISDVCSQSLKISTHRETRAIPITGESYLPNAPEKTEKVRWILNVFFEFKKHSKKPPHF